MSNLVFVTVVYSALPTQKYQQLPMYHGFYDNKLVGIVFIDLAIAFDIVDHFILCKKLDYYRIRHQEIAWSKSYLTSHKKFSIVNGKSLRIKSTS